METSKSVGLRAEDMAFSIARGAIEGTRDVGGDLGATARDTIQGTVTGTQEVGGNIIEDTQRSLIRGASEVGGDVAKSPGTPSRRPARAPRASALGQRTLPPAAANGTVSAAGSFGDVTVSTVTGAVTGTISDVRVVVRAPFRDENQQQS